MYDLTNIPHKRGHSQIKVLVKGTRIELRAQTIPSFDAVMQDEGILMCAFEIPDHMLTMPHELRLMIGEKVSSAITSARDAGYAQSQSDIQKALGLFK